MYAAPVLPPIIVHSHDYNQLVLAGTLAGRQGRPHASFLLAELRRANLCRFEEFPDGAVSMGSRITYRLKGIEAALTGTLVFEHDVDRCPDSLSIASPVGTALLGLRVGDRMPFRCGDQECEVLVEHVVAASGTMRAPCRQDVSATNSKENLDRRLDHALEETFPASDPVSVVCT